MILEGELGTSTRDDADAPGWTRWTGRACQAYPSGTGLAAIALDAGSSGRAGEADGPLLPLWAVSAGRTYDTGLPALTLRTVPALFSFGSAEDSLSPWSRGAVEAGGAIGARDADLTLDTRRPSRTIGAARPRVSVIALRPCLAGRSYCAGWSLWTVPALRPLWS